MKETLAAIDIGSNAIRLAISYVDSRNKVTFKRAAFLRVPIRLGEDVFTEGEISADKRQKLCDAMVAFSHVMKTYKVTKFRACATSAMREAANGAEVVEYIHAQSGIQIEIISGQEEAKTIFEAGDVAGLMNRSESYIYVDVGGGSTEVTVYSNGKRATSESFRIGTVRTISDAVDKSEPKRFKRWLEDVALPYHPIAIIGSGGNINKVHKLLLKKDREAIRYIELKLLYNQINEMSYEERVRNMRLNTYRADVITPAMKLFLTVAKVCKVDEILVPKVGLADGIIHHLFRSKTA
ncbi:MAG: hypothetical protein R3Y44_07255 [Rikenellaceae bacterium]